MKAWQFITVLFLAILCLGLSLTMVAVAWANQRLQLSLQAQQAQINNGILGQRGRQISGTVLQDMAAVSLRNAKMRDLLTKHGYTVKDAAEGSGEKPNAVPAPR